MLDPEDNLGEFPTLESQNIVDTNHANTYLSENNNDDEDEIFNGITQLEINSPSCNGGSVYNNEWSSSFGDDRDGGVSQSIAERRAATRGFNAGSFSVQTIKVARFRSSSPLSSPATRSPYITIPAGISPAELLDSPVMLPCSQAQPSPTTGTFQISPLHRGSFMLDSVTPATDPERAYDVSLSSRSPHLENHISFPSATSLGSKGYELPDEFARSTVKNSETELSVDFEESRVGINHLPPQSHPEGDQQADPSPPTGPSKASEDGYNWRKYGQKQVKGSELPRSYYRCTYPECKMSKKVERFHDGEVAEIIYIGNHNHPQPHPNPRSNVGNSFPDNGEMNEPLGDDGRGQNESSDPFPTSHELDCHDDNKTPLDGTSIEDYGYLDESEPKRRKIEAPFPETRVNSRGREPKVVVQIESEVDILEDGYRWRKYGQKVVKGNPNPRSYYKCTSPGCKVRKHVERARDDYKFVITTYEGKHDHEVPAAKTTGVSGNNSSASTSSTQPAHALSRFNTNAPRLDPQLPRIPDLGNEFMRSALLENLGNDMYPLQFPRLPNPMSYGYGGMPNFQMPLLYGVPRPLFTMQDGMDLYNLPVVEQQTDENDVALIEPKQENI